MVVSAPQVNNTVKAAFEFIAVVGNICRKISGSTFKQIFETVFSQKSNAFRQVVLVEFPRKDAWTVGFITADAPDEIKDVLNKQDMISVYVPTTPNPTSGYLIMYAQKDIIPLDMSVEDGLKMVISLGIVVKKKGDDSISLSGIFKHHSS